MGLILRDYFGGCLFKVFCIRLARFLFYLSLLNVWKIRVLEWVLLFCDGIFCWVGVLEGDFLGIKFILEYV